MLAGDRDRRVRAAPEIDRDIRLADALHGGEAALEAIILAGEIKWHIAGPDAAKHLQIFVGAGVALVLGQEVAVLAHLRIVTAGDDVDGHAPLRDLIERGELPGRKRR